MHSQLLIQYQKLKLTITNTKALFNMIYIYISNVNKTSTISQVLNWTTVYSLNKFLDDSKMTVQKCLLPTFFSGREVPNSGFRIFHFLIMDFTILKTF